MADGTVNKVSPTVRPPMLPAVDQLADSGGKSVPEVSEECNRLLWALKQVREDMNSWKRHWFMDAWEMQSRKARLEGQFRDANCPGLSTDEPRGSTQSVPDTDTQTFSILSDEPRSAWWVQVGSVMALGEVVSAAACRVWQAKGAVVGLAGSFFASAGYFDHLQQIDAERGHTF